MANIKFSQFTVGNTQSDIDFVVGYKGPDNVQISPTNLLASSLGNYLPLAGGTMTGDILLQDNVEVRFGTGGDSRIYHDAVNTYFDNFTGDLLSRMLEADKIKSRLREIREYEGLSQIELAKRVKCSVEAILYLEEGSFNPSVVLAIRLAKVLKCKMKDIFELK